jgi:hypothetical protein
VLLPCAKLKEKSLGEEIACSELKRKGEKEGKEKKKKRKRKKKNKRKNPWGSPQE